MARRSNVSTYVYDDRGNRTSHTKSGTLYTSTFASTGSDRMTYGSNVSYCGYDHGGDVTCRQFPSGGTQETLTFSTDGLVSSVGTASGTSSYVRDWRGLRLEISGPSGAADVGTYTFMPDGTSINLSGPASNPTAYSCTAGFLQYNYTFYTYRYDTWIFVGGMPLFDLKSHQTETISLCGSSKHLGGLVVDGPYF